MQREPIVFVGTSDLSGHFRGKSFPAGDLPARLQRGVGLAPTNIFISAFGPIQMTTFGTQGEVFLIRIRRPACTCRSKVPRRNISFWATSELWTARPGISVPPSSAPRTRAAGGGDRTQAARHLRARVAAYSGVDAQAWQPYGLASFRRQGLFGEVLLAAMRKVGVVPDSFLSEFGPQQFEVTCAPVLGMRAADDAVITRELAQAVAFRLGQRVSFNPIPEPSGTSNGTHIHWSFLDEDDRPALYDEHGPWQLSPAGSRFIAGIQRHLPALCALTAPSVASYYRLRPIARLPVRADVGRLDRGAAVRICPAAGGESAHRARQFNAEFRVADATASPYLALAALVHAGLDGIRRSLEIETKNPPPLPASLDEALQLLEASEAAPEWWGGDFLAAYLKFKRAEIKGLQNLDEIEVCRRYAEVY